MTETYRILQMDDIRGAAVSNTAPAHCPEFTTLDSPCEQALIDFRCEDPALVSQDISIDHGLHLLRGRNCTELLVIDGQTQECRGLISARDIVGEKPIRYSRKYGKTRAGIAVGELMEPLSRLRKVEHEEILHCRIGDIVKTLKDLGQEYLMITTTVKRGRAILGFFSITHIGSTLDINSDAFSRARLFAELGYVLNRC